MKWKSVITLRLSYNFALVISHSREAPAGGLSTWLVIYIRGY
jgi:hypothetical protein